MFLFTSFNADRRKLKISLKTLFIHHIEMLFYYIIFSIQYLKKKNFQFFSSISNCGTIIPWVRIKKTWIYTSPVFFLTNWILRLTKRTPPPQKKSYLKLFLSLVWPQLISCGPAYLMIMIGANLYIYLWGYHTNFRLYPFWRRFFKDVFLFFQSKMNSIFMA